MGLALFSTIYSIGYLSAAIYRLSSNLHRIVDGFYCFLLPQNITFLLGSIGSTSMLFLISIDRMIATKFIAFYLGLGKVYAFRLLKIVMIGSIFCVLIAGISSFFQLRKISVSAFCSTPTAYPVWFTNIKTYADLYISILTILMHILTLILLYFMSKNSKFSSIHQAQLRRQKSITLKITAVMGSTLFLQVMPRFYFTYQVFGTSNYLLAQGFYCLMGFNTAFQVMFYVLFKNDLRREILGLFKCRFQSNAVEIAAEQPAIIFNNDQIQFRGILKSSSKTTPTATEIF